jgi:hypothetical protein
MQHKMRTIDESNEIEEEETREINSGGKLRI